MDAFEKSWQVFSPNCLVSVVSKNPGRVSNGTGGFWSVLKAVCARCLTDCMLAFSCADPVAWRLCTLYSVCA